MSACRACAPPLEWLARERHDALVPMHFEALLRAYPDAVVRWTQDGVAHGPARAADVLAARPAPPALAAKFFHFRPVSLRSPVPCGAL